MRGQNKTPAEVLQDQGRGERENDIGNDETTARRAKRKLKNVWFEDGGRFLFRYGPNGSTVFDIWKWTGEALRRRA